MNRLFLGLCATAVSCAFALQFPATAIARSKETVLHSFGNGTDGAKPAAGLIDLKGTLYGTTDSGGADGYGTVFLVNPKTGAETAVYSFAGGTDGAKPVAGLIDVKGTLYGTTVAGGTGGDGTVFSVNPKTGAEAVVHTFVGGADGAKPVAGLIVGKGTLYGTTESGGTDGDGTVFSVNPMTGAETVIYSFCRQPNCTDGANPVAGLIEVNGKLYGTTEIGGTGSDGTVFSVDPTTGAETVVYSFVGGTDGEAPFAGLIDVNGTLYGTTEVGGPDTFGTVFSVDQATGAETVVYSFTGGTDGLEPLAGVIAVRRTLYGTTSGGGIDSGGTVFALKGP